MGIKSLLVLTEGSPTIGLGHLVECRALVERWSRFHALKEWLFLVEGDIGAVQYLERWGLPYRIVENGFVPSHAEAAAYDAILVNKKAVSYPFLQKVRSLGKRTAVIDELGHKAITADVLVNFSANPSWRRYDFPDGLPLALFGPEYFPASVAIIEQRELPKPADSRTIMVSMGGYDNSRITDKVLEALRGFDGYRKEIILGPGFCRDAEFERLAASLDGTFSFAANVTDMPRRIHSAVLLVNSGGNTAYEAALLGTPLVVIGEDPHEVEQGAVFERMGYAVNVAEGKNATPTAIAATIRRALDASFAVGKLQVMDWYSHLKK